MESKRPHLDPVKTPDDRLTSARTHNNLMDITTNPRLPSKKSDEEKESKSPHRESSITTDDNRTSVATHSNSMQSNIKEANNRLMQSASHSEHSSY